MRIVSQNGEFDFPYEMTALRVYERHVYARFGADARDVLMAVYNDSEMAKKAMNRLFSYVGTSMPFFQFPFAEEFIK